MWSGELREDWKILFTRIIELELDFVNLLPTENERVRKINMYSDISFKSKMVG